MNGSQSAARIISQINHILTQISDEAYCISRATFNGSSFGQHFRHILDFYNSVIKGTQHGILDYADRPRSKSIESSTGLAKEEFFKLQSDIDQLDETKPLKVISEYDAFDGDRPIVQSSVGRELMYAYDHAVHHLAIIKIGLKTECKDVIFDETLGVAPSTIRHQSQQNKS